ncbi:MAG: extracellular solute-binding protein [Chloroflexi bacterium]|nr:MAG: extracellular solute-binding protein [Chloroflexota bacterium]
MIHIVPTQPGAWHGHRRSFLGVCLLLPLLLLSLASCGLQSSNNTGGKISLTLWYWNNSIDDNVIKAVSQHFPNIVLNAQKISDYDTKVRTSMAGHHDVPDIMGINANISTYFPDEDQFVDLRQLGADQVKSQYLGWKWNLGIAPDGKQIGFPMDTGPTALFYRPDIFAQAGLPTDPQAVAARIKTWDDYLQAGVQLKAATHGKSYMIDSTNTIFTQMMAQSPTLFFDRANHYLGDQAHIRQMWNEAVKANTLGVTAKVQSSTQAWNEAVSNGLIASFAGAVWMKQSLEQSAPNTAGKWRVAPAPGGAGNNGGSFLAVTTACQYPKEAFAVIQWLQSPANQLLGYKDLQLFPSAISDLNNPGMHQPEAFFGREDTTTIFAQSARQVPLSYYGPENDIVGGAFTDQLNLVEFQKKNPDQAWNTAQQEAQRELLR